VHAADSKALDAWALRVLTAGELDEVFAQDRAPS
jgi:hypothetical protein